MSQKKKTIIIKGSGKSIFDGVNDVYKYCQTDSLFVRAFRKYTKKLGISLFEPFFYGQWKKELKNCDLVILFDNDYQYVDKISRYIKKKNPNLKIIFWYWNPLELFHNKVVKNKYIDEVWSYNRFDAKKYGLKYNTQFYRLLIPIEKHSKIKTDMVFLGLDKGREDILRGIEKEAKAQDLSCNFRVVKNKKDRVDYYDYLKFIFKSRCVVDIVPNQKCGLTRRPLEALFYGKKLITNYQDIINYDFYNKANVFVIGKDDMGKLAEFINSPYQNISKNIIDFYSYKSWLSRIEKGEDIKT